MSSPVLGRVGGPSSGWAGIPFRTHIEATPLNRTERDRISCPPRGTICFDRYTSDSSRLGVQRRDANLGALGGPSISQDRLAVLHSARLARLRQDETCSYRVDRSRWLACDQFSDCCAQLVDLSVHIGELMGLIFELLFQLEHLAMLLLQLAK